MANLKALSHLSVHYERMPNVLINLSESKKRTDTLWKRSGTSWHVLRSFWERSEVVRHTLETGKVNAFVAHKFKILDMFKNSSVHQRSINNF